MRAIGYYTPGPIDRFDSLLDLDLPIPVPGPKDVLVRVRAVSLNPLDTKLRAATSPVGGSARILGWDAAGIVVSTGSQARQFSQGDEVFYAGSLDRCGTNSEYHLVDERLVSHKPVTLDWAAAAALPLSSLTAWELLFARLRVPFGRKDQSGTLLVIDGAGGVGSILIQLARRLTGLRVVGTASGPTAAAWVRDMGAHEVIDHRLPFDQELTRIGTPEVEYIASLSGSELWLDMFPRILKPYGHIAIIDDPSHFDVVRLRRKSISVSWQQTFACSTFQTSHLRQQKTILRNVAGLVDAGILRTTMTRQEAPISARTLRKMHQCFESGHAIGKIVVSGFPGPRDAGFPE